MRKSTRVVFGRCVLASLPVAAFACGLSAVTTPTPTLVVEPAASPTATLIALVASPTATPQPPAPTTVAPDSGDELCDNDNFPSDDGATWVYAGDNSKTGTYTRTDVVTDSRDDGFTIHTKLTRVEYDQEYLCTDAGLIQLEAGLQDVIAQITGANGTVTVTRDHNEGLTLPRDLQPGATWSQFVAWRALSDSGTHTGSFNVQYTAMGVEVVTVPAGTFDAMHIHAVIDSDITSGTHVAWTYTVDLWFAPDTGLVRTEGASDLRGVEFTDTLELESYDAP